MKTAFKNLLKWLGSLPEIAWPNNKICNRPTTKIWITRALDKTLDLILKHCNCLYYLSLLWKMNLRYTKNKCSSTDGHYSSPLMIKLLNTLPTSLSANLLLSTISPMKWYFRSMLHYSKAKRKWTHTTTKYLHFLKKHLILSSLGWLTINGTYKIKIAKCNKAKCNKAKCNKVKCNKAKCNSRS